MAAQKLGVEPVNCIGIEDAYAGVEAIKSAGMKPIGIGNKVILNNCDIVNVNLAQIDVDTLLNT